MLRVLAAAVLVVTLAGCGDGGSVFRAEVGDCMVRPPEGEVEAIDPIDCDREHLGEVVGIVEHDELAYPGAAALSEEAFRLCQPLLDAYVGAAGADLFGVLPLSPTEGSWNAELRDRESLCIAVPRDLVPHSGSVRDLEPPESTTTTV